MEKRLYENGYYVMKLDRKTIAMLYEIREVMKALGNKKSTMTGLVRGLVKNAYNGNGVNYDKLQKM